MLAKRNQARLAVVEVIKAPPLPREHDRSFLENLDHQIHLQKSEAEAVIPMLAHEKQVDLIVMGTVCRTGIAGVFIGNTAEKILQVANY